jgi:hypothetical protein
MSALNRSTLSAMQVSMMSTVRTGCLPFSSIGGASAARITWI